MRYYAYLKQGGEGCDYTIGCGSKLLVINAENDKEATDKLSIEIGDYRGEYELEKVILFKDIIPFDLENAYGLIYLEEQKEKDKYKREKDLKELERLKKQYGV